jgi:transposase
MVPASSPRTGDEAFQVSAMAIPAARENHRVLPRCSGCRERDLRIAQLEQQLAALQVENQKLGERVRRNASNSSMPPSTNPPDAPKFPKKKPSGRKRGGQPGHPPHPRKLVPPQRVNKTVPFVPAQCPRCQTKLPKEAGPNDPPPSRHQVAELPELTAHITEYQGHARTCPCCGEVTRATIPADVRAHSCGPRLAAVLSYLAGCHHVSKRGLEEIVETVFDAPISLGTVSGLEQEMSAALAPAHVEALQAVQAAPVKNVDETGWKQGGIKRWLWLAATATVAVFLIHLRRSAAAMIMLLGERVQGIICSDRWWTYNRVSVWQRQICWAHLIRDFQKCVDRGGPAKAIGDAGLTIARGLFKAWHTFRGGGCSPRARRDLQRTLSPLARQLHNILEAGCGCADKKAARFCANLLDLEPALWMFVVEKGVEPTNNHAERVQRCAVLWRKNSFGCDSERGCRFVERILTAVQTLRLQGRKVLPFLYETLLAHRSGQRAPQLVSGS